LISLYRLPKVFSFYLTLPPIGIAITHKFLSLVPKLLLMHALAVKAPAFISPYKQFPTGLFTSGGKQSFAGNLVPKQELGNQMKIFGPMGAACGYQWPLIVSGTIGLCLLPLAYWGLKASPAPAPSSSTAV
jgi:hypothetical protein